MDSYKNWAVVLAPNRPPEVQTVERLDLDPDFQGLEVKEPDSDYLLGFFNWYIDTAIGSLAKIELWDDAESDFLASILTGLRGVDVSYSPEGKAIWFTINIIPQADLNYDKSGILDLFVGRIYLATGGIVILTMHIQLG